MLPHALCRANHQTVKPNKSGRLVPYPPLSDGTMRSSIHQPSPAFITAIIR